MLPLKILLVEDNPADIDLTRESLTTSKLNIALHPVLDGIQALEFLRRQGTHTHAPRPDLILLDLNLPKRDGRDVLSDIKADPDLRRIPVVVLRKRLATEPARCEFTSSSYSSAARSEASLG